MYIQRALEQTILKYLRTREIIAVVGPRQCGKTTLLRHIHAQLENAAYIDFEQRDKLELFESDLQAFLRLHLKGKDYLFIDEFQYARQGGKRLKEIFDHQRIKILVTGSSSSELAIEGIQYLVGRVFVFRLYPLSFSEFLSYRDNVMLEEVFGQQVHSAPVVRQLNAYLDEYLVYGGYPRVVLSEDEEEKQLVLRNIYDTYFLKDIRTLFQLAADHKLSRLIQSLALQVGGLVNYNELGTLAGLTYHDLKVHLNILCKTFITRETRPYYSNPRLELVKSPKFYFVDNGFRNTAARNFQPVGERSDAGALRENFVASELIKSERDFNFWRTKSKAEVDFVFQHQGRVLPIETKSKLDQPKMTRAFHSFVDKYAPREGWILNEGLFATKQVKDTSIHWLPIYHLAARLNGL